MPELELTVERLPGGSSRIPGWVDGRTIAVITHRGTDSEKEYTREYTILRDAMEAMGRIELYENLELVSATMIVAEPATEPGRLRELLAISRGRVAELHPRDYKSHTDMRRGMAVLICSVVGLNSYYRSENVELILHTIEGGRQIEDTIAKLQRTGRISS